VAADAGMPPRLFTVASDPAWLHSAFDQQAMKEGWHNDDYLILFEGGEIEQKEQEYRLDHLLPGHRLLGLVGWDDFLAMESASQKLYRIPISRSRRSTERSGHIQLIRWH